MIDKHFTDLMEHARYSACYHRVFIEANMSYIDAGRIANQLKHARYGCNLEVVRFDASSNERYGVWTSQSTKEAYCNEIQREIYNMRMARIFLSHAPEDNFKELCVQLGSFRSEIIVPSGDSAMLFHKKLLTGKSSGKKDDIWMALGIMLYYMQRSQHDIVFQARCNARGISSR